MLHVSKTCKGIFFCQQASVETENVVTKMQINDGSQDRSMDLIESGP